MLLRRAHSRAARTVNGALRPIGIEGRHLGVLLTLARSGPLSQTQLVEALGSEKSQMVRTVDDLERRGAVARRPDPVDRRAHLVELTGAGQELLAGARKRADDAAGQIFAGLGEDELQVLHALLTRIADRRPT
jgi:DNA-binding MarR family transcriptional regulator